MSERMQGFVAFADAPWSKEQAERFALIREWRSALCTLTILESDISSLGERFEEEAGLIDQKKHGSMVPASLTSRLFEYSAANDLPLKWFTAQVKTAHRFYKPLRFSDSTELKQFINDWAVPQANLIAHLNDLAHTWQLPLVRELATAFFLMDKLAHLKDDLKQDRLFIPLTDLEQAGVEMEQLQAGRMNAAMQKLLWKQAIRVRDAFAQGQPLVKEVPRKFRRAFKRNWLTGLEYINEIERRKYDVWSKPIELSRLQLLQIRVLSFIGKGASQARMK